MSQPNEPGPVPRQKLSRALLVDTAVELFAATEDVSIRELAGHLGVSPMALYRHVESKEDLLDETVDRLLATRWRPQVDPKRWRAWTMDAADRLRRFLLEHPAALQVYLRRPVRQPVALERMTACLDVLREALGDDARAHSAYAGLHSYTLGFAALESARNSGPAPDAATADALLLELAGYASPAQFRAGLGFLLDGVSAS